MMQDDDCLDVNSFGHVLLSEDLKRNLGCGEDGKAITDPHIVTHLRWLQDQFRCFNVAGEGEEPREGMSFKEGLGMVNSALRRGYGLTLCRSAADRSFYTLQPLWHRDPERDCGINFADLGYIGPDDERALVANKWIRFAAVEPPQADNNEQLFLDGGVWDFYDAEEWDETEAEALRNETFEAFPMMGVLVESDLQPENPTKKWTAKMNRRTAWCAIEAVYGRRAHADNKARRLIVDPRGSAPLLTPFGCGEDDQQQGDPRSEHGSDEGSEAPCGARGNAEHSGNKGSEASCGERSYDD